MAFNIAIDGPAGAGKSTIAKMVAKELSFVYVDTGAMYRAMSLYFIRNNIDSADKEKIKNVCKDINVTIEYIDDKQQVILNGENVTDLIRTEEVSNMTSAISVYSEVRQKLMDLQRKLAITRDVIMDGRDIGTTVLPNANIKIFLTADTKVRAKRRYLELTERKTSCNIEEIEKDIIERDKRDMTRAISPLKQAEDAILVDTSNMSIDEVVAEIIKIYRNYITIHHIDN